MSLISTRNSLFSSLTHAHLRGAALALLLLLFTIPVGAQEFSSTSAYRVQQIDMSAQSVQVEGYQQYHSTIYEPFSSSTPSYGGSNNDQSSGMGGRRNTTIDPGNGDNWGSNSDGGDQENSYSIGEPWIMLAFAAVAALVISLRKQQHA